MVVKLLLSGFFGLLGLGIVLLGVNKYRTDRLIAGGPVSPQGNEGKTVLFTGTVEGETTTAAPLSGEDCVCYTLALEVHRSADTPAWEDVETVRDWHAFVVDEGSARVLVPDDVLSDRPYLPDFSGNYTKREVENESDVPEAVREAGLLADDGLSSLNRNRIVERRLDPGDTAIVVGKTERNGAGGPGTHRYVPEGMPVHLTNVSMDEFEGENSLLATAFFVFGGGFFAFVCFAYILTALGVL